MTGAGVVGSKIVAKFRFKKNNYELINTCAKFKSLKGMKHILHKHARDDNADKDLLLT